MFSRLRKLCQRWRKGMEHGARGCWRACRPPCFKRKIHPSSYSENSSSTDSSPCASDTSIECKSSGSSGSISTISSMACSISPSMDSMEAAIRAGDCCGAIAWYMQRREKQKEQRDSFPMTESKEEERRIRFLTTVASCCEEAQMKGEKPLRLGYTKPDVIAAILEVVEQEEPHNTPSNILQYAMVALCHLSKVKPKTPREVETHILGIVLHGVASMKEPRKGTNNQRLFRNIRNTLVELLQGFLEEDPTSAHLFSILENICKWLHSTEAPERVWASQTTAALLRHATLLENFESEDLPVFGRFVAELSLRITDGIKRVSQHAREALDHLYEMLLRQKGISIQDTGELWCCEPKMDWQSISFRNTVRMGKVFWRLLSAEQRATFVETALQAVHKPLPYMSHPALLILYSVCGLGEELLGKEPQDTAENIRQHLPKFLQARKRQEEIERKKLKVRQEDLIIEDIEEEEKEEEDKD